MVSSKRNKSQRNSQVKVTTNWHYTEEMPPAFKWLMSLLLREKSEESRDEQRDKFEQIC